MDETSGDRAGSWLSVLSRWAVFFVLWLTLAGTAWPELAVGALAAAIATWISCRLLPAGGEGCCVGGLTKVVFGFVWQSIVAGVDVAWRAMQPRMPLSPGFVEVRVELRQSAKRSAFLALSSLMPGTLPTGSERDGVVEFHCLDVTQPVVSELEAAERRFAEIWRKS